MRRNEIIKRNSGWSTHSPRREGNSNVVMMELVYRCPNEHADPQAGLRLEYVPMEVNQDPKMTKEDFCQACLDTRGVPRRVKFVFVSKKTHAQLYTDDSREQVVPVARPPRRPRTTS